VDTINWTGWKLVEIPISSITGTGDKLFHSIVLVQSPTGLKNSVLYFDAIQTSAISDVEPAGNDYLPKNYALEQNYPNPFNPMTNIRFQIPTSGFVSLKIYDILGNEVATLINETMQAGTYNVKFDATKLNSGVYFYTLRSGDFVSTKKLILLK
jgi:hypothetical protein